MRTTFIANVAIALVFSALLPMGGKGQPAALLWQPALVAVLFVAGQVFAVLALSLGDVSVATPVLGAKTHEQRLSTEHLVRHAVAFGEQSAGDGDVHAAVGHRLQQGR